MSARIGYVVTRHYPSTPNLHPVVVCGGYVWTDREGADQEVERQLRLDELDLPLSPRVYHVRAICEVEP